MPATDWALYRVGARLGAIDDFLPRTDPARATRDRVQRLISTVAVAGSIAPPAAENSLQVDDRFVARLALGLLARGWPTLASPAVEKAVRGGMVPGAGLRATPVERFGEVGWSLSPEVEEAENGWPAALAAALSAGDPRLVSAPKELDEAETPADPLRALMWDSVSERRFYRGEVADLLGNALGLVELQRPLDTMVPPEAQPEQGPWVSLPWRRADFSLELPGSDNPWRLNIELDGPHHREPTQKARDHFRDEVLTKAGWTVVRVPIEALDDPYHPKLVRLRGEVQRRKTRDPTFRALVDGTPVDPADPVGLEALRLLVAPHAVARVQLGVVLAMLNGALRLDAPTWEIVAVEREVPCAEAALVDLLQTLLHLCRLYGIPFGVEGVRLRVAQEHLAALPSLTMDGFPEEIRGLVAAESLVAIGDPTDVPDLVLDAAVLARPTQVYPTYPAAALGVVSRTHLVLRTAHRSAGTEPLIWDAPRPVSLEPPEHSTGWDAADGADSDLAGVSIPGTGAAPQASREPLRYFLQTLFRKRDFRPGQLEIIDRALARRDVIGLLPTGAGKSICYQLPALLSPGQTLVVDPIKSLMQDQVDNLAAAGVDDAVAINSDLEPGERRAAEAAFGRGDYRFVFVSPERLQIEAFRKLVTSVGQARPTAYVVVDEAHCVSEWGHDFRIAYLNLGRLSRDLCVFQDEAPPMVALTGTASRAVLVDVQRELRIDDDEAIVSPTSFDRPELRFAVESVASSGKRSKLVDWVKKELPRPDKLGIPLAGLVSGGHGGIVFCPHIDGAFGVFENHRQLGNSIVETLAELGDSARRVGFYSGREPDDLSDAQAQSILQEWGIEVAASAGTNRLFTRIKTEMQARFKSNDLAILVATKAFGMGIDKPNIRYTVHYGMAESVEAFAQEAGRAGRDRTKAICLVLFSDNRDGQTEAPDPLELGIGVEESRQRMPARGEPRDDADRALWLHAQSYAGVEAEATAIRGFYRLFVRPAVDGSDAGSRECPPVVDREAMARLNQEGWLPKPAPADGSGTGTGPADDPPKIDFQRIVYRLSLLGIVEDYTVEYGVDLGNTYSIILRRPDPRSAHRSLRRYVERYRFSNAAEQVEAAFATAPFADPVEKAIHALCWFTYEEVEKQRRADIHTMRQYLRDSLRVGKTGGDPGVELRRLLNAHLSESHFTAGVEALLGGGGDPPAGDLGLPARFGTVADLLGKVEGPNDADQLVGQARRYRSSDPDNPALLALVGLGLAHNPRRDPDDAAENLRAALALLGRGHDVAAVDRAASWIVGTLAKPIVPLGERTAWALLAKERAAGGGRIARAAYRRVAATTPRLKRACALPFLSTINDEVGRTLDRCLGEGNRTDERAGAGFAGGPTDVDAGGAGPGEPRGRADR